MTTRSYDVAGDVVRTGAYGDEDVWRPRPARPRDGETTWVCFRKTL